jgi:hypothetical protein
MSLSGAGASPAASPLAVVKGGLCGRRQLCNCPRFPSTFHRTRAGHTFGSIVATRSVRQDIRVGALKVLPYRL